MPTIRDGVGVSEGIVEGVVRLLSLGIPEVIHRRVEANEVEGEVECFQKAREDTKEYLHELKKTTSSRLGTMEARIFDPQILMLDDVELADRTIEYILDRGLIDEVREGDEVPVDVSFEFNWIYLTGSPSSGALPTIKDALTRVGNASAWVSSDPDGCSPYAVDIEILYEPSCSGPVAGIETAECRIQLE